MAEQTRTSTRREPAQRAALREPEALPAAEPAPARAARPGTGSSSSLPAQLAHRLLQRACAQWLDVPFEIAYWDGARERFGVGAPLFRVTFRCPAAVWRILRRPDPAFGEAYMSGDVEVDNLDRMLDVMHTAKLPGFARLRPSEWPARSTSVPRQYQYIQSHYDRGNTFFALWLDASRTYSCAYFRREGDDLDTAQTAKIDHVLRKAQLRPGDTLLDIGSGWGGLVLRAAQQYGARAHGITLSRQQYDFTREAIRAAALEDRASVDLLDYRELVRRGATFDRVVSVGMLEHVGKRNLPLFLRSVKGLLKPSGVGVIHSITQAKEGPVSPWIRRYVFPGGYIPSWREVIALLPECGFHLIDAESLRRHYALTLAHWAQRFEARRDAVRGLGFDETFIRMWRFYLRACAAGFRVGTLDLHQLAFTHGVNNSLAMTREHLYPGAPDTRAE